MILTNDYSDCVLILKDGDMITVDGSIREHFDLRVESTEVIFDFPKDAYNLPELKSLAVGGSLVPQYELHIDGVKFDVLAMGAKEEPYKEITMYIVRK